MKLLKQTRLHFREGNSNKVYEADLCEVGEGQYVVNFRYGKHGANLTEGTKTAAPLPLNKAQETFDKILKEKIAKGYQDVSAGGEAADPLVFVRTGVAEDDRKNATLWHLSLGISNPVKQRTKRWNIKRAIWRAGQLRLVEAVPHLLGLFGKGLANEVELYNYCILWALARCAQAAPEPQPAAIACLQKYAADEKASSMVRNIANNGLSLLVQGEEKTAFFAAIAAALPEAINKSIADGQKLTSIINSYISERAKQVHAVSFIYELYLLSREHKHLHAVVAAALDKMPMRANFFKHIRAIYKAAQQADDFRIMGLIAAKIDTSRGNGFKMSHRSTIGGQRVANRDAIRRVDSPVAYATATAKSFRRHGLQLAKDVASNNNSNDFVRFATAYLLSFDDATASYNDNKISDITKWNYDYKTHKYNTTKTYYPQFSTAPTFGYLMYSTHETITFNKNKLVWVFSSPDEEYNPEQDQKFNKLRRELLPQHWDANPQALVHLIIEARASYVFNFALRAFENNEQKDALLAKFDLNLLFKMLDATLEARAAFALAQIKARFKPSDISAEQITSLFRNRHKFVREYALDCIAANAEIYYANTELIANFLTSDDQTLRQWVSNSWAKIIAVWGDEKRQVFLTRMLAYLMQSNHSTDTNRLTHIIRLVSNDLSETLKTLNIKVIVDLLGHTRLEISQLGAAIVKLQYENQADRLPLDTLNLLLSHYDAGVADTGRELMQKISMPAVVAQYSYFVQLYLSHKNTAVSSLAKVMLLLPLAQNADFGATLLNALLPALFRKELREGQHHDIYKILIEQLANKLSSIDRDVIFRLLNSEHLYAQELAGQLIAKFVDMTTFSLRNIVRLANHKVLNVRQIAWNAFNNQVPRMKYEAEEALRILDSDWEDSRSFARTYFRNHYTAEQWTAQLLVSICDSVREDVQAFGTELLTKFFTPENGSEYLLQLSQHPRPRLQLYATNYLESYAAGQPDTLLKLEQYFITVLSQVNRGRIAKDRIFAFLHREGLKSEVVARLVADIIGRISATGLIQDRAQCIEIMRDLHLQFADIAQVAVFE
jgi:predicted DNA-binding WGR domain protein